MAIRLEINTQDPEEIELIQRYWAVDESGGFIEKVKDLVPFRELTQSSAIASYVRERCKAYDDSQPCTDCGEPAEISSRSDINKYTQRATRRCSHCRALIATRQQALKAEEAAQLATRLADYARKQSSQTCAYQEIGDAEVLILMALECAITPRLTQSSFTVRDCSALCAGHPAPYIKRLVDAGILVQRPFEALPGAYFIKDDDLWCREPWIAYGLAPDPSLTSTDSLFEILSHRTLIDGPAIADLWLDYATQDVMHYFRRECETYQHRVCDEALQDVESSIRSALTTYSVAQLWSVVWKVVRDAASLASRTYYNREKAAATLPGKLRRHMEKVEREAMPIRAWSRREEHPAGTLGMVFWELFQIEENTPGSQAVEVLSNIGGLTKATSPEADLTVPAAQLIHAAVAENLAGEVLLDFAALIQRGTEVPQAIQTILNERSQLQTHITLQSN